MMTSSRAHRFYGCSKNLSKMEAGISGCGPSDVDADG